MTEFRARVGRIRFKSGADVRVLNAEPLGNDVVTRLEEALDRARQGKVSSVAVAVVYRDGTSGRAWSTAPSLSALIGSVSRLHAAIVRDADDA